VGTGGCGRQVMIPFLRTTRIIKLYRIVLILVFFMYVNGNPLICSLINITCKRQTYLFDDAVQDDRLTYTVLSSETVILSKQRSTKLCNDTSSTFQCMYTIHIIFFTRLNYHQLHAFLALHQFLELLKTDFSVTVHIHFSHHGIQFTFR
jgi:hypothetical protein